MAKIEKLLGDKVDYLLNFRNPKISKDRRLVPSMQDVSLDPEIGMA